MRNKVYWNMSWKEGIALEQEVASIFSALGARVERDIVLSGSQIDLLVREETPAGATVTTIVECKAYSSQLVGSEAVYAFASLAHFLQQRGEVDQAILVASTGFTSSARRAGKATGVELLEIVDLRRRVSGKAEELSKAMREIEAETLQQAAKPKKIRIFVAMPFTRMLNDVYILGVRDVAERLGCVVERADEVEHNGYIVSLIQDRLSNCDIVVADTTARNPNVFYEVGYAHALGKPTVLICREGEDIPFDVKTVNHIIYGSIVELRPKLERRLRSMLGMKSDDEHSASNG